MRDPCGLRALFAAWAVAEATVTDVLPAALNHHNPHSASIVSVIERLLPVAQPVQLHSRWPIPQECRHAGGYAT